MALYRKGDPAAGYREAFQNYEDQGFHVSNVRYRMRDDGAEGKRETIDVEMTTPYTYAGEAVTAFATIVPDWDGEKQGAMPYSSDERLPGVRPYSNCMLMLAETGKNLEDVSQLESGTRAYVVFKNGEPMASKKAYDEIGQFAAAASHYPSAMTFEEYQEVGGYNFAKIREKGFPIEVTTDGYLKYLSSMKSFAEDPHARMVGAATTPRQIQGMIDEFTGMQAGPVQTQKSSDMSGPLME